MLWKPEAALSGMLGGAFEHAGLRAGLRASGSGENPDFSVGQDAVDVEDDEFDFAGADSGG